MYKPTWYEKVFDWINTNGPIIRVCLYAVALAVLVVTALYFPRALLLLLTGMKAAAISGLIIGGVIGGISASLNGGNVLGGILEGAVYGALDGAALATVVFGIVAACKAIATSVKAANAARTARAIAKADAVTVQAASQPAVAQAAVQNADLYRVGRYCDIKGAEGLQAHHVGQKAVMKELVPGYNPNTAPAINVPIEGHMTKTTSGLRISTKTSGFTNARQVIARDIMELRRVFPDVPNSALRELIQLNITMYGL